MRLPLDSSHKKPDAMLSSLRKSKQLYLISRERVGDYLALLRIELKIREHQLTFLIAGFAIAGLHGAGGPQAMPDSIKTPCGSRYSAICAPGCESASSVAPLPAREGTSVPSSPARNPSSSSGIKS